MPRPYGPPPTWATDETYTQGAWAGEPTKIDPTTQTPSVDIKPRGWYPGRRRAAQHENHFRNRTGDFLSYLDALEVQNWKGPYEIGSSTSATSQSAMVWASTRKKLFATMGADIYSSFGGKAWTAETLPASPPIFYDLAEGGDVLIAVGEDVNTKIVRKVGAGAWADVATGLASGDKFGCVGYFAGGAAASRFICGGELAPLGVHAPQVVYLNSSGASPTIVSLTGATWTAAGYQTSGYNGPDLFAASSTLAIIAARGAGLTKNHIMTWTSTDGASWTARPLTAPLVTEINTLIYDAASGLFEMTTGTGEYYYSVDGIAWQQRTGPSMALEPHSLAAYGGIWVAAGSNLTLFWSANQGSTWHEIIEPIEAAMGGFQRVMAVDDRFVLTTDPRGGDGVVHCVFSLRRK